MLRAIKCPSCGHAHFSSDSAAEGVTTCRNCGAALVDPTHASLAHAQPVLMQEGAAAGFNPFAESVATDGKPESDSANPYQSPAAVSAPAMRFGATRHYVGVDPRTANRWKRFVGAWIDVLFQFAVGVAPAFVLFLMNGSDEDAAETAELVVLYGMIAGFLVNGVLTGVYGKSIGKFVLRMTVVRIDNEEVPGFVKGALVRTFLPALLSQIPFFAFADAVSIFSQQRRCLHDLMAGTKVLDDKLIVAWQNKAVLGQDDAPTPMTERAWR